MFISRAYLVLFLCIAIWSFSPLVVYQFKGAVKPFQSAALVVFIAFVTSLFFAKVLKVPLSRLFEKEYIKQNLKNNSILAFLGFFIYPICYFTAIQSDFPIEANIANYLWPIIASFTGLILIKKAISLEKCLGLALGLFGVSLNVWALNDKSFAFWGNPLELFRFDGQSSYTIVSIAFLAALSYGIYSGFLSKLAFLNKDRKTIPYIDFVQILGIACLIHMLVLGFFSNFISTSVIAWGNPDLLYLVLYAIVNLAAGHYFWLKAIESFSETDQDIFTPAIAVYLVPVFSTVILYYLTGTDASDYTAISLTMIVVGVYLSSFDKTPVPPFFAATLTIFVVSIFYRISAGDFNFGEEPGVARTEHWSMTIVLTSIFSIMSAFILNRVAEKNQKIRENFLFLLSVLESERFKGSLKNAADDIERLLFLSFCDEEFSAKENQGIKKQIIDHIDSINASVSQQFGSSSELLEKYQAWDVQRHQKISLYEKLVLYVLAATIALLVLDLGPLDGMMELGRLAFLGALVMICMAARDFDKHLSTSNIGFFVDSQRSYSDSVVISEPLYSSIHVRAIISRKGISTVKVTDGQKLMDKEVHPKTFRVYFLAHLFFILSFIAILIFVG